MPRPTAHLPHDPLFDISRRNLPPRERIVLSYQRARAIGLAYALTVDDVLHMSQRFWDMHQDPICSLDGAAMTLLTIQYNLGVGVVGECAQDRPELRPLLHRILTFQVSAQYCLTEVAHGLDAIHMETTATRRADGSFDLHTPSPRAAKFMPPTTPVGVPCVAIVLAKLIVDAEDRGVRPFIVALNDGVHMCAGVTARELPPRGGGASPLNHSLTYFHHVRLAPSALLGTLAKPADARLNFLAAIERVRVGSFAIAALGIPALQVAAFIAARYSMRRTVDARGSSATVPNPVPILAFRTQQLPVLTALAQAYVLKALHDRAQRIFCDRAEDPRVRHGVGAVVKVVTIQHCQAANLALSDRCGAQGLYEYNQLTTQFGEMRGSAIAEGDVLALSIRLASELLLGRYALPPPRHPASLLARHETALFAEHRALMAACGHPRSPAFDRLVLPQCLPLVQALGQRLAHEAALDARVRPELVALYVAACVRLDPAWFVEQGGLSRRAQADMEDAAVGGALPLLEELLVEMDVEGWVQAPIVTEERWERFVADMPLVGGDAHVETVEGAEGGASGAGGASGTSGTSGASGASEASGEGAEGADGKVADGKRSVNGHVHRRSGDVGISV